jgi:hypothetical protein
MVMARPTPTPLSIWLWPVAVAAVLRKTLVMEEVVVREDIGPVLQTSVLVLLLQLLLVQAVQGTTAEVRARSTHLCLQAAVMGPGVDLAYTSIPTHRERVQQEVREVVVHLTKHTATARLAKEIGVDKVMVTNTTSADTLGPVRLLEVVVAPVL